MDNSSTFGAPAFGASYFGQEPVSLVIVVVELGTGIVDIDNEKPILVIDKKTNNSTRISTYGTITDSITVITDSLTINIDDSDNISQPADIGTGLVNIAKRYLQLMVD